jgi:glycosyltransferase involved in cell wall biosynthesis
MSCGLPVIGTDVPGIRELITHRETGYLCGTSAEALQDALGKVLSDARMRDVLGVNARQFVIDNFSLEKIVELELSVYATFLH